MTDELPAAVLDRAVRLTRLARGTTVEAKALTYRRQRDHILAQHGYVARIRSEQSKAVLVCYPAEWVDDATVQPDRIDDPDRAAERPLNGSGNEDNWEEINASNRQLVEAVEAEAGRVHARNAAAFADFMGNHYCRSIESATHIEVKEFLNEYYPRNAWPSPEEKAVIDESLEIVFEVAGRSAPTGSRDQGEGSD